MEFQKLKQIIRKYNSGEATPEEKTWLESWYDGVGEPAPGRFGEEDRRRVERQLRERFHRQLPRRPGGLFQVTLSLPAAAAAVLLLAVLGGGFYFLASKTKDPVNEIARFKNDIAPGAAEAVLTLADGTVIPLDSLRKGAAILQGGATARKDAQGKLVYEKAGEGTGKAVFNTLSTPMGGKYRMILPDGTKVWLNAASSIRYPTAFTGKKREVEMTGEIYFEVAENNYMPFVVKAAGTEVRVLGTHFNVMAYPDEPSIRTTLMEGSVQVARGGRQAMLAPGQQAVSSRSSAGTEPIRVREEADPDRVIAWKNDLFQFDNTPVDEVMRQIARWYNAKIEYGGLRPAISFTGLMPRDRNVSEVLKILELAGGVKFGIEGRVITVTASEGQAGGK